MPGANKVPELITLHPDGQLEIADVQGTGQWNRGQAMATK